MMDQEDMGELLEQFTKIKKEGMPCELPEARNFYNKTIKGIQKNLMQALSAYLLRIGEQIPYNILIKENSDALVDDGDYVMEKIAKFSEMLPIIIDLYRNPSSYSAWKGNVTINGKEETMFYIELKTDEKKLQALMKFYI
ncbi:MAG: hypothetical protein PHG04_02235 [Candidatus Nanoarchaeia archaeon]|nr:hypothetical protein [Candidatus Nanoarchaeia archaeon]MDD5054176.1 hypothetical protein [Candidatus Nanoarchaeia archaeon]